jgi:hypothetical protein
VALSCIRLCLMVFAIRFCKGGLFGADGLTGPLPLR